MPVAGFSREARLFHTGFAFGLWAKNTDDIAFFHEPLESPNNRSARQSSHLTYFCIACSDQGRTAQPDRVTPQRSIGFPLTRVHQFVEFIFQEIVGQTWGWLPRRTAGEANLDIRCFSRGLFVP